MLLPTAGQGAAMELVAAGREVATRWREDPVQAAALVLELTAGGELGVEAVLDAAAVYGLLARAEARTTAMSDPSTAAELCLAAAPASPSRPRSPPPTSTE